jgi:seryl-tRNA synthetase
MNAQTATAIVSLEEMESQLQALQKERVRIEESLDGLRRRKSEKDEEARPLKKLLAAGDKSASAKLDRIDAEIRDIARREDSLRADEAQLAPKIVSLQQLVNETRRIRVDEELSQRFDAACDAARAATDKFSTLYAELTKAAGELACASADLLMWGQEGASAYERLVLNPTFNPNHRLAAQGWGIPVYAVRCVREFFIRGMLPPTQ